MSELDKFSLTEMMFVGIVIEGFLYGKIFVLIISLEITFSLHT